TDDLYAAHAMDCTVSRHAGGAVGADQYAIWYRADSGIRRPDCRQSDLTEDYQQAAIRTDGDVCRTDDVGRHTGDCCRLICSRIFCVLPDYGDDSGQLR